MISLSLLLSLSAAPSLEWPKLVEVMRAPNATTTSALQRYLAAHRDERGTMRMALVFRALEVLPGPAGSFTHRITLAECTRMTEVLRKKPALLPSLDCRDVITWQQKLDEGWTAKKPSARRAIATPVIDAAAPARDQVDVLVSVNPNPGKYFAELYGVPPPEGEKMVSQVRAVRDLLFELVAEADALATDSAGDCEEFLMRYPDHPFAASALFATGHLDQLRARFPKHPLSSAKE